MRRMLVPDPLVVVLRCPQGCGNQPMEGSCLLCCFVILPSCLNSCPCIFVVVVVDTFRKQVYPYSFILQVVLNSTEWVAQSWASRGQRPRYPELPPLLLLLSHSSRVRLWDPIDGCPPGPSVPGILQARTLEWGAISFSPLQVSVIPVWILVIPLGFPGGTSGKRTWPPVQEM